jgi:hypothetical protein
MRQMFAKGRSAKSANVSFFEGGPYIPHVEDTIWREFRR